MNLKNIGGIILLIGFFWGFTWLIGNSAYRGIERTRNTIENAAAAGSVSIGPVTVPHDACHHLFPVSWLDRLMGNLTCPSCNKEAKEIHNRFIVTLVEKSCSRRGINTMYFVPRQNPVTE